MRGSELDLVGKKNIAWSGWPVEERLEAFDIEHTKRVKDCDTADSQ